jgi:hypothetical protein
VVSGLAGIEAELADIAAGFDAATLLGSEAAEVVRRATRIANLAGSIQMAAAARVAQTPMWKHNGHRSPADWLAAQTKSSFGEAKGALDAAGKLEACPKVAERARRGELTPAQTEALAKAVAVDPAAEDRLLGTAERDGLGKLKDQCRAVALSKDDVEARSARIHRERSVKHWTDHEGAFRLAAKLTPEAGATVLGALAPFEKAAFDRARKEGRHEPHEGYLADALVDLACASLSGHDDGDTKPKSRKPSFTVLVDIQPLLRGHAEPGETCEIPGVGPIPVSRLHQLAPEAFWHVLVTRGKDIRSYCAMTRSLPAMLKVALAARDRECTVPGCNQTQGLEIDHIVPLEDHGPTTYTNLTRKCYYDHRENKHRRGLDLDGDAERAPP